ncbi:hypothetical protein E3N88_19991 [Mikania micrantha]|uniref:Inhibitor I9 domain-containing protein n=1 Tax=Mikania micrantha TaxID=192012 RepID=A0A5N6NGZ5_9ASTR|nr:hypothetical protein E3N88_19991 [Mikania micrantha]
MNITTRNDVVELVFLFLSDQVRVLDFCFRLFYSESLLLPRLKPQKEKVKKKNIHVLEMGIAGLELVKVQDETGYVIVIGTRMLDMSMVIRVGTCGWHVAELLGETTASLIQVLVFFPTASPIQFGDIHTHLLPRLLALDIDSGWPPSSFVDDDDTRISGKGVELIKGDTVIKEPTHMDEPRYQTFQIAFHLVSTFERKEPHGIVLHQVKPAFIFLTNGFKFDLHDNKEKRKALRSLSKDKAKIAIFYSYTKHINGFAAMLEDHEAAQIADPQVHGSPFERIDMYLKVLDVLLMRIRFNILISWHFNFQDCDIQYHLSYCYKTEHCKDMLSFHAKDIDL